MLFEQIKPGVRPKDTDCLTQILTDAPGRLHVVNRIVVKAHVEGITVVLIAHPLGKTIGRGTVVGHWGHLQLLS